MLTIVRVEQTDKCVRGVMLVNDVVSFVTLERPWKNNSSNESCIPIGTYPIRKISSPKFGVTYEVRDVPNRFGIICPHAGNTADQTHGCVLIGMSFGVLNGEPAVLSSAAAMSAFRKMMPEVTEDLLGIFEIIT